jgi:uncharacterized protein YdeI (BOF family)
MINTTPFFPMAGRRRRCTRLAQFCKMRQTCKMRQPRKLRQIARASALVVAWAGALAGCQVASSNGTPALAPAMPSTPIQQVRQAQPSSSAAQPTPTSGATLASGAAVYLQGTVGDRVPLAGGSLYELEDSSGKIWVQTKGPAPDPGQTVALKGIVRYRSIPLNGQEQGEVYVEQE